MARLHDLAKFLLQDPKLQAAHSPQECLGELVVSLRELGDASCQLVQFDVAIVGPESARLFGRDTCKLLAIECSGGFHDLRNTGLRNIAQAAAQARHPGHSVRARILSRTGPADYKSLRLSTEVIDRLIELGRPKVSELQSRALSGSAPKVSARSPRPRL